MDVVLRAAFVFLLLGVVMRISGKRQIAQLSAFDLILLVTMGDLIGQTVLQEDYSLTAGSLAVTTFGLLSMVVGWIVYYYPGARPVIEGQPTVVLRDGKVDEEVTSYELLAYPDLLEAAREAGIRDLAEVELAIMEVDGSLSFFKRHKGSGEEGAPDDRAPDKAK
jgi:uncharacterized membrane protein YcaP (DUF421 family)